MGKFLVISDFRQGREVQKNGGGDGIRTHEYGFCKPAPWSSWLRRLDGMSYIISGRECQRLCGATLVPSPRGGNVNNLRCEVMSPALPPSAPQGGRVAVASVVSPEGAQVFSCGVHPAERVQTPPGSPEGAQDGSVERASPAPRWGLALDSDRFLRANARSDVPASLRD